MPKRSKKSNQGCCLTTLFLWPFQLLDNLVNPPVPANTERKTQPTHRKRVTAPRDDRSSNTDRFMDVIPSGRQSYRPSLGVPITYESRGTSFVKAAQKVKDKSGKFANHAPFKSYWPTYNDMNGWQNQWYFYWRTQVRRDNFLPTDLSYIFVHVYEILNLVETADPIKAAARIRALWLAYRGKYSNLDRYLPDWGGDLLAVKTGGMHALEWWESMLDVDGPNIPASVINTIVEKAIRTNGLEALPYRIWSLLSDYQPRNKFYQKYNTDHFVDSAYEKAIKVANAYYLKTTSKSLIDHFVSDRKYNYEKHVFASALIGFPYPNVTRLASGRDYAGSTLLAKNITSIMKYAENILRKQQKFSAKLSGIDIPTELAKHLDQAFLQAKPEPKQPEPVNIVLDQDRVASLHQESRVVTEMLATDQNGTEKELLTDLNEVRALWKACNLLERRILAGLLNQEINTILQLEKFLDVESENFTEIFESINKKSSSVLGDKLIYENASAVNLAEDFIDELEVIVIEIPPSQDVVSAESAFNDLDPWIQFFDTLEPVEVEITKILGGRGQIDETEIDSIARDHNAMGNAVMDSLNEKAQKYLNQLPFYLDGAVWYVEEEYFPNLRQHLGIEVN